MSFSSRRAARVFFLCLLLGLIASGARAEILIEPSVGFHGVFQLGRAFPLDVELSNVGRPVEGTLEIRVWKGGITKAGPPYPLYYRKQIFLPARSKKNIQFTLDPDFISRPLTIAFSGPGANGSREVDLRRHFSPAPVMLLVTGGGAPAIALGPTAQNRLVSLALAELPADPRALLGVSHLILYDVSLRELSRWQMFALDNWILSGGRLIILGSINYALYQEAKLRRFLPVRVAGWKKISSLGDLDDSRSLSGADVWAQASSVVEGKLLAEDHGTPLLVEAGRGKGRISYVAVDLGRPPLSRWAGAPKLFRNLLAPVFEPDAPPRPHWDDGVFSQLIQSPSFISTYVPAGALLLASIAYLIVVGGFVWLWQRNRLPRRVLLISLAGLIIFFTGGGYLFFSRGGNVPDGVLLTATVLDSVADGFVEAQAGVALFSTQMRQYNLRVERGWLDWVPVYSRARDREASTVVGQDSSGVNLFQLPLREWDYRLFKMRFVERFQLRAGLQPEGDKLVVTVDNQSPADLADCWLMLPGRRFALGNIPRGAPWRKAFPLAAPTGPEDRGPGRSPGINLRDISFGDKTRDVLFHASFFSREGGERWAGSAAIFFGWVKEPRRWLTVDDARIRATDYTLFRAILPLADAEDDA